MGLITIKAEDVYKSLNSPAMDLDDLSRWEEKNADRQFSPLAMRATEVKPTLKIELVGSDSPLPCPFSTVRLHGERIGGEYNLTVCVEGREDMPRFSDEFAQRLESVSDGTLLFEPTSRFGEGNVILLPQQDGDAPVASIARLNAGEGRYEVRVGGSGLVTRRFGQFKGFEIDVKELSTVACAFTEAAILVSKTNLPKYSLGLSLK